MSGMMAKFFANFIPVIALIWALDALLIFRILYREIFGLTAFAKIVPSLVCLILVIVFMVIPFRTCINKCFNADQAAAAKTYEEVFEGFITDYDIENPVSKNDGILRKMEAKLKNATEDEK